MFVKRNIYSLVEPQVDMHSVQMERSGEMELSRSNLSEREVDTQQVIEKKSSFPIVSIPGYDRIVNPKYSRIGQWIWTSFLILCFALTVYQTIHCILDYKYATPAIQTYYKTAFAFKFPALLLCPADLTGDHPKTRLLKQSYQELFNKSNDETEFFDLIKIPGINTTTLWDIFGFHENTTSAKIHCGASAEVSLCVNISKLEKSVVRTPCGTCLFFRYVDEFNNFGADTFTRLEFPEQPKSWFKFKIYSKIIYISSDKNPQYFSPEDGFPLVPVHNIRADIKFVQVLNINSSIAPCYDGDVVEKCIETCIRNKLNSKLPCRLPFMDQSLRECSTPTLFKESYLTSIAILKNLTECDKICPRKCLLNIVYPVPTAPPSPSHYRYVEVTKNELLYQIIEEYDWYTFTALISDIGSNLGTFLGLCILNIPEILEALVAVFKNCSTKKNKVTKIKELFSSPKEINGKDSCSSKNLLIRNIKGANLTEDNNVFTISITGFDRLLNSNVGIHLRITWALVLCFSTAICCYQVSESIAKYCNGLPDTRFEYEKNDTIKFPTFTFCPFKPFEYPEKVVHLKEMFQEMENISNVENDISFSDLIRLPDMNISLLWEATRPQKATKAVVKLSRVAGMKTYDNYSDLDQVYVKTAFGECLSIITREMIVYEGIATNLVMLFQLEYPTYDLYKMIIHDDDDNPMLMDPLLQLTKTKSITVLSFDVKKIVRANHPQRPTASKSEVINCQLNCLNDMWDQALPCRLPYMKNSYRDWCNDSKELNQTITKGLKILFEFHTESGREKCNCPLKNEENILYLYPFDVKVMEETSLPITAFITLIQTNIFMVLREFYQFTLNGLFNQICGSLGLLLGICIPSLLEVVEYLLLIIRRF